MMKPGLHADVSLPNLHLKDIQSRSNQRSFSEDNFFSVRSLNFKNIENIEYRKVEHGSAKYSINHISWVLYVNW